MIRSIAALVIAATSAAVLAQTPPTRIRGTLEQVDGNLLTIKARSGEVMKVKVPDNVVLMGVAKASMADIGNGKFIGTTTVGQKDGALVAEEVHIFPENMRGTGEGHRDWDLRPESKMTNANVADIKNMGDGRVMTVQYKGGEKKVLVTPRTSVVSYEPASRSDLKPGTGVFVNNAEKQPDGTYTAPRVNVGLRGQMPPM
ncbi:MAG TPA: hypothetical protein VNH16_20150 [Burkholderiales bacterium]|jgi:hypothetical protein|nr:hypothetical protein [Burkholderiales bacterium]